MTEPFSVFVNKIILTCLIVISCQAVFSQQSAIELTIHNIRSSEGTIRIGVYDNQENFNKKALFSFQFTKEDLKEGELRCRFTIPYGAYAFSLLDDENNDDEMNFSFLGIPKEGYGFSRDASIKLFSPPSFEDCKLTIDKPNHQWRIKVRYF